ncbi:MAG: type III pantothenate kinase [Steroidobacteraceae bacterium]
MTLLLIDIGNSRIKWASARNGRIGRMQALPLAQFAAFARALRRLKPAAGVRAVCVAGRGAEKALRQALAAAGHPAPQFVRSTREAAGVTNGYRDPWRLGADRWVAAIGAWHAAGRRRSVCAVSVGTALTIDVVDSQGRHRGGLIAPGPLLMRRALLGQTHGIAVRAAGARRGRSALPGLADNTRDAIDLGSVRACAALVDRCITELRRSLGTAPRIYLTGGAAPVIAPLLACRAQHDPALVLHGLAVVS